MEIPLFLHAPRKRFLTIRGNGLEAAQLALCIFERHNEVALVFLEAKGRYSLPFQVGRGGRPGKTVPHGLASLCGSLMRLGTLLLLSLKSCRSFLALFFNFSRRQNHPGRNQLHPVSRDMILCPARRPSISMQAVAPIQTMLL